MDIDPTTLQTLLATADRQAIENVLGTYCRAIDRLDLDLLKSVYHADGFDDHGAMKMNAHEFAEKIIETLRGICTYSMHTITQTVIDVQGDTATSEAYYIGYHTIPGTEDAINAFFGPAYLAEQRTNGTLNRSHAYICGGRYIDVLHKRDGVWRIFNRKMTNEYAISQPETNRGEGMVAAFFTGSARDRSDPVYSLLQARA